MQTLLRLFEEVYETFMGRNLWHQLYVEVCKFFTRGKSSGQHTFWFLFLQTKYFFKILKDKGKDRELGCGTTVYTPITYVLTENFLCHKCSTTLNVTIHCYKNHKIPVVL